MGEARGGGVSFFPPDNYLQAFLFLVNKDPLIALAGTEMKYSERFKSTTPKLICMLIHMFVWKSPNASM